MNDNGGGDGVDGATAPSAATTAGATPPKDKEEDAALEQERKKSSARTISKADDEGFELVFDILFGIRNTVSVAISRQLPTNAKQSEFNEVIKVKFPHGGSSTTPAHSNRDFKFFDYAPLVFRRIRGLFDIDQADYLLSLTQEYNMSEIVSPGKSKSFFYYSRNLKYMLKTLYDFEADFLRKILPHYYDYLCRNRSTLLTRFFGFHAVKPHKGALRHFVVMNNVFSDNLDIPIKYDLKGSTFGRTAFPNEPPHKGADLSGVIQKDLDFDMRLILSDSMFLDQLNIMDYSLLLGVFRPEQGMPKTQRRRLSVRNVQAAAQLEAEEEARPEPKPRTPVSFFERDEGGLRGSGEDNEPLPVIYYMGIIDILQPYNMSKKVESKVKIYAPFYRIPKEQLSAVGPHLYARRFQDFLIARVGPGKIIHLYYTAHKGVMQKRLRLSRQHQEVQDELESDRLVRAVTGFDKDALLRERANMTELHAPVNDEEAPPPEAVVPGQPVAVVVGGAAVQPADARSPTLERIPVVEVPDENDDDAVGFL